MDFSPSELTPELKDFAREVGEWLDANTAGMVFPRDPMNVSREEFKKRRELGRKAGEKGWLFPTYPKKYGGGGMDGAHAAVLRRECAKRRLSLPPYHSAGGALGVPAIMACGTEEQKELHLPPIMRDGAVTWELFTEPEAGSDEANQQTNALRAERDGEYFIVNGGKIFVGGIYGPPDLMLLLVRSDTKAPRHQNLACFMAPGDLPGMTITGLDLFVPSPFGGVSGQSSTGADGIKHQVFFDDVRIHEKYLIGGDHDGWKVATATLEVEHGGGDDDETGRRSGAAFFGESQVSYIVRRFLDQCNNNPNVRQRIRENPHLVDTIMDIYIDAHKERLYMIRNAGRMGGRYGGTHSQFYTKLFSIRLIQALAKVLGPYAFNTDDEWAPDEGLFEVSHRGALCLAPTGTPEILKVVLARLLAIGR